LELKRRGRIFRKEMEKILKRKKKEVLIGQRKGILNPTELHKLASMEVEVFKKIISPQSMENAVYVLRDGSGSMWSSEKSKSSVEAASVIEEGIKGLIPYKDVIFHTFGPNITHEVICDFSDKNTKENKAWNYQNFFNGTNKDGFSIRIAVAELMRRTEQGKILFVLSDGLPSDYRSENEAKNDVKSIVREAKKNGISVISIFFGSEHERNALREKYREMYGNSVICVDPSKIEKNIINILKKMVKNT
jgi:nitric oxide reductase activation protein